MVIGAPVGGRGAFAIGRALRRQLAVVAIVVAQCVIEVDDLLDADLLAETTGDRDERSGIGGEERGEIVGDLLETRTWSR